MRFGSLLILLFLVVIQLPAFAQADSTVSFISYWNKGESRNYKITKSKTRYKNDSLTVDETESYKINIKVLDSTATSYLIEWTYLNSLIPGKQIPEELKPVLKKYKNLTLKYRTNELGTFLELVNYKEVSKMMRKAFTKISAKDKNLAKVMEPTIKAFSSRAGIEGVVLKEIQYFHFPLGIKVNYFDTIRYEDHLPNAYGGDPIRANSSLYFSYLDTVTQTCEIINELQADPEETTQMVATVLRNMAKDITYKSETEKQQGLANLETTLASMTMEIYDVNLFRYDYYFGWPEYIKCLRTVNSKAQDGSAKILETIEIEVTDI